MNAGGGVIISESMPSSAPVLVFAITTLFPLGFPLVGFAEPVPAFPEAPLPDSDNLEAGLIYRFDAPLNKNQRAQARTFGNPKVTHAHAAISVPEGFNPQDGNWTVVLVHTTRDLHASNLVSMPDYIEPAGAAGCLVLAADGPVRPTRDSFQWRWAMNGAALDALHARWPESTDWTVIPSGYSGGAKMAAQYGAILTGKGIRVGGIFMGGCNEDFATPNRRRAGKAMNTFLDVPMFLCLGEEDWIARPEEVRAVAASLMDTGFRHVRVETHPGGHRFQPHLFSIALSWFMEMAKASDKESS